MKSDNSQKPQAEHELPPGPTQAGILCPPELEEDPDHPAPQVIEALKHILESEFFRTSTRGRAL